MLQKVGIVDTLHPEPAAEDLEYLQESEDSKTAFVLRGSELQQGLLPAATTPRLMYQCTPTA